MKERTVHTRYKESPVLLDKALQDIQKGLKQKLPWLDNAFGRAYRFVEHRSNGDKLTYPAMYNGNSEYVSLLPNDNFGNFSWFDIYDPQQITEVVQSLPQYTFTGALVFWYNLDTIFDSRDFIFSEEIKDEIIRVLTTPGLVSGASKLTVTEIYERFENIYKGEGIQSVDKQFFMHPYAGLRIEFKLTTRELCQRHIR